MLISVIIISALVFLLAFLLAGLDLLWLIYRWQARIHIGRWENRDEWLSAVRGKAVKWLRRTPPIPLTDNRRYVLLDILRGNFTSESIKSWQVGGLILGLGEEEVRGFLKGHSRIFDSSMEVDAAFTAYALQTKGLLSDEWKSLVESVLDSHIKDGSIQYRSSIPEVRYVDTVGLVCPFLYSIGRDGLADRQISQYDQVLLDGVFPPHAFDLTTRLPLGVYDWGRGTGWYILGLVSGGERQKERILRLSERLLPMQRSDGSFGCFLFNEYSPKDSSATVLMGLLFVTAWKLSRNEAYLEAAGRAERALMKMTRRDGAVDNAQGDTKGIGMYSSRFGTMPFVQGMTLHLSRSLDEVRQEHRGR